jgi:hypothetical protein
MSPQERKALCDSLKARMKQNGYCRWWGACSCSAADATDSLASCAEDLMSVRTLMVTLGLAGMAAACSPGEPTYQRVEESLFLYRNSQVSPDYWRCGGTTDSQCSNSESAATVVYNSVKGVFHPPTYVVSYNAYGGLGWNTSNDYGATWPTPHTSCRDTGSDAAWQACTKDTPRGAWKWIDPPEPPTMGGAGCQTTADWGGGLGDPSLTWTGNPGQAAMSQIQMCSTGAATDIVVTIINNVNMNGQPVSSHRISDSTSGMGVDGTLLVLDESTKHIFATWKGHQPAGQPDATFVRTLSYGAAGNITFLTPPRLIVTRPTGAEYPWYTLAFGKQGWCDATNGCIYFVSADNAPPYRCPSANVAAHYVLKYSTDLGITWHGPYTMVSPMLNDCTGGATFVTNPAPRVVVNNNSGSIFLAINQVDPVTGRNDVVVYRNRTTDAWTTWTQVYKLALAGSDQFRPAISWVDNGGANGMLGLVFYTTREDGTRVDMWGATSLDDGTTWSADVKLVTAAGIPWPFQIIAPGHEYDALVPDEAAQQFLAIWADRRKLPPGDLVWSGVFGN